MGEGQGALAEGVPQCSTPDCVYSVPRGTECVLVLFLLVPI